MNTHLKLDLLILTVVNISQVVRYRELVKGQKIKELKLVKVNKEEKKKG